MRIRKMNLPGFRAYTVREDGVIYDPAGGRVRLLEDTTNIVLYKDFWNAEGEVHVMAEYVIARTFVESTGQRRHVRFKDRNPMNLHSDNLEWYTKKRG